MKGLKFGLVGGITFALVQTGLNYFFHKEFTFMGLAGGMVWFLTSILLGRYFKTKE